MAKTQTLTFKRTVNASPAEVYRAFTNSTALREWLCEAAQADSRRGGRLHLWWSSGYYMIGEYTALEPGKKAGFTWHGRGEPEATRVTVSLKAKSGRRFPSGDVTEVTLSHGGVGSGKKWAKSRKEIEGGWPTALENLQSVLETGRNLRFTLRPMLGISLDEFNADVAAKLGLPVTQGIRLSGVVEGLGAHAAGLQKDDVLVSLGGRRLANLASLPAAVQGRRAGDKVKVVFYRGREKRTVVMELSPRPLPDVPPMAKELAEAVRKVYAETNAELEACFQGVNEAEASHHPAPGEWNAKEVLAHLIVDERDNQRWIADLVGGHEGWYDDWGGNVYPRLAGLTAAYPTVAALLEELKRNQTEITAALAALPPEFVARKGSYWRLGHSLLNLASHAREHLDQIQAAVQAGRRQ